MRRKVICWCSQNYSATWVFFKTFICGRGRVLHGRWQEMGCWGQWSAYLPHPKTFSPGPKLIAPFPGFALSCCKTRALRLSESWEEIYLAMVVTEACLLGASVPPYMTPPTLSLHSTFPGQYKIFPYCYFSSVASRDFFFMPFCLETQATNSSASSSVHFQCNTWPWSQLPGMAYSFSGGRYHPGQREAYSLYFCFWGTNVLREVSFLLCKSKKDNSRLYFVENALRKITNRLISWKERIPRWPALGQPLY